MRGSAPMSRYRHRASRASNPLPHSQPDVLIKRVLARARYKAQDVTVAEIARALGVGRGTIYRALQQTP